MTALLKATRVPEEEYLTSLLYDDWRYEYVDGRVVAMAEPSDRHEILAGNIFGAVQQHLRKHPCRVFKGSKRARVSFLNRAFYYYPDVMVICDHEQRDDRFKENPSFLVEVLSPTTENTDIREKMFAYLNTTSVLHYVIVAQDKMEVTVYRRIPEPGDWQVEVLTSATDVLRVPDLQFQMSLADLYEKWTPDGS